MENEVVINKTASNGYIRMSEEMLVVFNPLENASTARRDRGDEINILMHVLNYLNIALNNNPNLTDVVIRVTHQQFAEMLKNKPITEDKITLNNIFEVIEKINAISGCMIFGSERIGEYKIYSAIEIVDWTPQNAVYEITLGHKFIEYYKNLRLAEKDYFKLYLDVMLSLSTRNNKIVYAYLCRYNSQMNNPQASYSTNETKVNKLKFYLDKRRTRKSNGDWEYKMQNQKVVQIVENALEEINKIIAIKREKYNKYFPLYKVEWIKEGAGKTSPITKFRFSIDLEDKKEYLANAPEQKLSYESIICNTFEDEEIRNILREFVTQGSEAEELPSLKSFKTQVENIKELSKEEIIERVSTSILDKDYRSLGYNKEVAEKLKTKPEPIVTNRENRHFDIGLKSRARGRK